MSLNQLQNYLRMYRKLGALSQEEIAFLLGKEGGAKVCRYERFLAQPNLEIALAYAVIFQRPLQELFRG